MCVNYMWLLQLYKGGVTTSLVNIYYWNWPKKFEGINELDYLLSIITFLKLLGYDYIILYNLVEYCCTCVVT